VQTTSQQAYHYQITNQSSPFPLNNLIYFFKKIFFVKYLYSDVLKKPKNRTRSKSEETKKSIIIKKNKNPLLGLKKFPTRVDLR
jgi:hypothetical protein